MKIKTNLNNRLFVIFTLFFGLAFSQTIVDYTVKLEPITIEGFMGIQSFSAGVSGDEVLIIGGRLDGLHRRQPFASFDSAGHNNQLIVLNLKTKQIWKQSLNHLNADLYNQLKATNHNSTQIGDSLFVIGGYGINEQTKDHETFPFGLKLSVSEIILAVKKGGVYQDMFTQVKDTRFAITGGQLQEINRTFYLVGGHRFDGRYNPIDRPTFVQEYLNGFRTFKWDGKQPEFLTEVKDTVNLHIRDYNLIKVQKGDENPSLMALSGVFQRIVDLPYLQAKRISTKGSVSLVPNFRQYYNQYECADVMIYDSVNKSSNVIFFGGISQFYDSLGVLVQDDNVPFTQSITRLAIGQDSTCFEYLQTTKMPGYLGAGSVFVQNQHKNWREDYFLWNQKNDDPIELGYIIGGIHSSDKNIFWINDENESWATPIIYKVSLVPTSDLPVKSYYSNARIEVKCTKEAFPRLFNKDRKLYTVSVHSDKAHTLVFKLESPNGKEIASEQIEVKAGDFKWQQKLPKKEGIYKITVYDSFMPRLKWEQYLWVEEE
jgi:hypothetical protein